MPNSRQTLQGLLCPRGQSCVLTQLCREVREGVCDVPPPDVGQFQESGATLQPAPLPSLSCLTGYVNHSLSVFYTKDFQDAVRIEGSENVTECRFGPPWPLGALWTPVP